MRSEIFFILKCDVVLDEAGWRIEYLHSGVKVHHRLNAISREEAIKEATMQGFTKITVVNSIENHKVGTVVVPKYVKAS